MSPPLFLTPLLLYPIWEAAHVRLTRLSVTLPRLPAALDGLTLLFISDLHAAKIGRRERGLIRTLDGLAVDLVLLGGDQARSEAGIDATLRVANIATARLGRFAVLGNAEHKRDAPTQALTHRLEAGGYPVLNNTHVTLRPAPGIDLVIAGVNDPHKKYDDAELAIKGAPVDSCQILLAHSPDIAGRLRGARPDLVLCGHTHAGQVRLPGIPPFTTNLKSRPDRVFLHGLFPPGRLRAVHPDLAGDPTLVVSAGVGTSLLPLRFCARPEVLLITLRSPGRRDVR